MENDQLHTDEFFGEISFEKKFNWYTTKPFNISCLNNNSFEFAFYASDNDNLPCNLSDLKTAAENFIQQNNNLWHECSEDMLRYCRDSEEDWETPQIHVLK